MVQPNGTGTIINSWLKLASKIIIEVSPNDETKNIQIFAVNSHNCS